LLDTSAITSLLPVLKVPRLGDASLRVAQGRPPAASDCGTVRLPGLPSAKGQGDRAACEDCEDRARPPKHPPVPRAPRASLPPQPPREQGAELLAEGRRDRWFHHPLGAPSMRNRRRQKAEPCGSSCQTLRDQASAMTPSSSSASGSAGKAPAEQQRRVALPVREELRWDEELPPELREAREKTAKQRLAVIRAASEQQRLQARERMAQRQLDKQNRREARRKAVLESEASSSSDDGETCTNIGSLMMHVMTADRRMSNGVANADDLSKKRWTRASDAFNNLSHRFSGQPSPGTTPAPPYESEGASELMCPKVSKDRIRLINGLHKVKKRQERLAQLLLARKAEFDRKPDRERILMTKAFANAGGAESGSLSAKAMLKALEEIGIQPKNNNERKELKILCEEIGVVGGDFFTFCFEAVSRARSLLRESREVAMRQDFIFYDADKSGRLDDEECVRILSKTYLWNLDSEGRAQMVKQFERVLRDLEEPGKDGIDFEGFATLFLSTQEFYHTLFRERELIIRTLEGLDAKDCEDHVEEVIYLHDAFTREASVKSSEDGRKHAVLDDIRCILVELGLAPRQDMDGIFQQLAFGDVLVNPEQFNMVGTVDYKGFLRMIRRFRDWNRYRVHDELETMFCKLDKDQSGALTVKEVNVLVAELGLMPRCREDQAILQRLITNVDKDGNGEMDFDEFSVFAQRIAERTSAVQTCRLRQQASEQGFSGQEFNQLTDAFHLLDHKGEGTLRQDELRKACLLMKCPMKAPEFEAMVGQLDRKEHEGFQLEDFLRFASLVLPGDRNQGRPLVRLSSSVSFGGLAEPD